VRRFALVALDFVHRKWSNGISGCSTVTSSATSTDPSTRSRKASTSCRRYSTRRRSTSQQKPFVHFVNYYQLEARMATSSSASPVFRIGRFDMRSPYDRWSRILARLGLEWKPERVAGDPYLKGEVRLLAHSWYGSSNRGTSLSPRVGGRPMGRLGSAEANREGLRARVRRHHWLHA